MNKGSCVEFVYIVECVNGSYYTGITKNIRKRYLQHVSGTGGAKYTRGFPPYRLACCWLIEGPENSAIRIEIFLKKLSRLEKEELVLFPDSLEEILPLDFRRLLTIKKCNSRKIERELFYS